ncbi:DUF397 domain-containing protein [Kineosporia sp. A_224]|uniref:DUF397 domain-containing protein n=1 Tax=Kineosporia sp. A_224 TaxID=1962180 RepID=UPI000B4A6FA9
MTAAGYEATSDEGVVWRRAAACGEAACVEVGATLESVAIRDSKNRCGGSLTFTRAEWAAFVEGVRRGEFDDL